MTFSFVFKDPSTDEIGCAAASKYLAVGAAVTHARSGAGAVATQALVNAGFGPDGLERLASGHDAAEVLASLLDSDELPERRQLGVLDATGSVASHTGEGCQPWAGHLVGAGYGCQGNMLAGPEVVAAMARAAEHHLAGSPVAPTLLRALHAAEQAGGDRRGRQSAALLVVRRDGGYGGTNDRMVDLRVDDHENPLEELARLLALHQELNYRPPRASQMPLAGELRLEVVRLLRALTGAQLRNAESDEIWAALERWAGAENLEERLVPGHIDPTLLEAMHRAAEVARR